MSESFNNPVPAVVGLVRVELSDGLYLLGVDRDLLPQGPALPGGYIDEMENAETAVLREIHEECGIMLRPGGKFLGTRVSHNNRLLIFFLMDHILTEIDWRRMSAQDPLPETRGLLLFSAANLDEIVFTIHKEVATGFFEENPVGQSY